MIKKNSIMAENFKLQFIDKRFMVNKEKGIVTCFLPTILHSVDGVFPIPVTGVGIARLKDGDVFDEEIGKKIALTKAENNAYRKASTKVTRRLNEYIALANKCGDFIEKSDGVIEHNIKYINRIGG